MWRVALQWHLQVPQHSWAHPFRAYWLMHIQFAYMLLDLILSHQGYIFLAPAVTLGLWDLRFLKARIASKDWGKDGILHLCLFHVLCNQVPCLINQWAHIFLSHAFVPYVLTEAFLLVFDICGQIQFSWALAFLTSSQDAWTKFLYSSQVTHPWFHPL